MISSRSIPREEALSILDPNNEIIAPTNKQKYFIVKLFQSHGITEVISKSSPIEFPYGYSFETLSKRGIASHQRLIMIDLTKKDQELKKEFDSYLKLVYARHKDAKEGEKRHSEFYVSWEPDTKRARTEIKKHLAVWKLRKKRIKFLSIARQLNIRTTDLAQKSFYRAYELSQGEPYDKELFNNKV